MVSISGKVGCSAYTLHEWVKKAEVNSGRRIDWFNHRRLLEPIGNIPPAEAEKKYHAAADNIDMAA